MIVLRIRMRIARIGMKIMMKMMRFWMTMVGTEKMRWIMDFSMFSRWHEHCRLPICEQCYPELGINIATLTTIRMSLEQTSWNPWKKSPELLYITIPNLERVEKSEEKSPDAKRSKRKNLSWLSSPIAPMAVIRTYKVLSQLQRKSQTRKRTWSWLAPPTTTSTGKLNHPGYWDIWTLLVLNWDGRWFSKECWFGFKAHLSQKVSLQVKLENGVPHIGSVYHVAVEGNNERCWNEIQPFTGLFGNFPQMAAWFHRVLTVSIADLTC